MRSGTGLTVVSGSVPSGSIGAPPQVSSTTPVPPRTTTTSASHTWLRSRLPGLSLPLIEHTPFVVGGPSVLLDEGDRALRAVLRRDACRRAGLAGHDVHEHCPVARVIGPEDLRSEHIAPAMAGADCPIQLNPKRH